MGLTWNQTPDSMMTSLTAEYAQWLHELVVELANTFAPQIEAWLKANAPWTDRTGNLRKSLHAEVQDLITQVVISFDYGLDYGIFLELANAGRFAIIGPALDFWSVQVMSAVRDVLGNGAGFVSFGTAESGSAA